MPHRDLSLDEQEHVRVCLRSLRAKFGNWRNVERSLPVAHSVLVDVMTGKCEVSVAIASPHSQGAGRVHLRCDRGAGGAGRYVRALWQGAERALAARGRSRHGRFVNFRPV